MRRCLAVAVVLAGALLGRGETRAAASPADAARRAIVVAQVGPARAITVGELEDRLLALPAFQRAAFGDTPAAIRHSFLSDVVIRESLALLGAEAEGLARRLPTAVAVDRARSSAAIRAIRARLGPAGAIPVEDVRAYYEANRARYESPEKIQIWRILCPTRDEAQTVLDLALRDPSPKTFSDLARDHSQDRATRLRAGSVGFVTDDGASNEPGLRVDPAVVHAARAVRDGEIVPRPVAEGDSFAIVWRRGTIAASKHPVEDVAAQIRDALWSARIKAETDALVGRLRASNLRDLSPSLLDGLELHLDGESRRRSMADDARADASR